MGCSFQKKKAMGQKTQLFRTGADILDEVKDVDIEIFGVILELLRKEQGKDCIGFLSDIGNQKQLELQILQQLRNITQADIEQKLSVIGNDMKQITNLLKKLKNHDFNYKDFSSKENEESTLSLIQSIKDNRRIIEFLQFLVHLTAIDNTFIQCGSNSLHTLVQMKVDMSNQSFVNIRMKNTSLIGGNFVRSNLSGSEFDNVDISGLNLNGAQLFNCKWKNLKIHELNRLDGHSSYVKQVCFSPDGNTLASGSGDCSIRLWDVKTGQQKAILDGHSDYVMSVCFSPDGNTLASGIGKGSIILWDTKTRKKRAKLDGHSYGVMSFCFSPDGNTLASGSVDKSIRLWDVKTGQQKAQLDGHSDIVMSVCFSPDGNALASGSYDKSIRLWEIKTGQQKAKLHGHSGYVMSFCFSPDGNTLASGSRDNSIRLWDVKTGQQKAKLDGHSSYVYSVCFSPDGNTLTSSSNDNSIRLWDVKTGQEIKSSDKNYKDILAQLKIPLQQNSAIQEASNYITTLLISQQAIFQAQGALILRGEFINQSGIDLKTLFKQKGSCILEDLKQK
ncbi:unnamed protein product [Paramecium pentaurelia]|uniref:Uncharacterized protein n=1 Tax=Paramecium pentaurelia TaxID=43138 RepID=A0A8S1W6T5_9CILI|nr:unnamed protein product [Paramecium pentaurelia]